MTDNNSNATEASVELTPAQRLLQERMTKLAQIMETETDPTTIAQAIGLKDRQGLITWCRRHAAALEEHGKPDLAKQFYR
jgi:methylphosphotriester-DNA--protein-cysteine methyltransferase